MTDHHKTPPMLAADYIRELVQGHTETIKIDRYVPIPNIGEIGAWRKITEKHTISHPPLLDQLEEAARQSKGDATWLTSVARSKPNARLDAVDCLRRIDRQSRAMAAEKNLPNQPLRARLLTIAGTIGTTLDPAVRSWWISARCLTGWEIAPYEPDVPCPNIDCETRGTLRIRLDTAMATCTKCGEVWDDHNYTQLGDYIRWASEHLRGARHWLYDQDGYPTECIDCLTERANMAERRIVRSNAEHARDTRKAG